ncbi:MAG: sulfurtransferase-like selenium metabolism protein YedF [Desulfamplus sp.]|nr:sulfurtransferase-like selenium metabolism protein YedF [Desulfamplus sp.]
MSKIVDARGLSCPAPVLMAKKAIDDATQDSSKGESIDEITVIVDNEASMENVSRFLTSRAFNVEVLQDGSDFKVFGKKDGSEKVLKSELPISKHSQSTEVSDSHKQKILVLAATDRMGFGDDELGKKLMVSFLKTIKEMGDELWRLVFVNNGVKLTIKGSAVLEDLLDYEKNGLKIMVCGTCLTHFNLLDAKKVGETTNMLDIVTAMQLADKVINI